MKINLHLGLKQARLIQKEVAQQAVETRFFQGLIELQYGQPVENKLRLLARRIPWARGWPEDKKAFWNAEAFMWQQKIAKEQRQIIALELSILEGKRNLDLGCGAYSYLPAAVGVDLADKMLQFNERVQRKVQHDLNLGLPFPAASFDSVTAIFLLNYIKDGQRLLQEIVRVLRPGGVFVVVLAAKPVQQRYQQQETNHFSSIQWKRKLSAFFQVKASEREKINFLWCYRR
ncbi:MAG: class I SAM-dependent methyltransferase [Nanoarchaeota archaeon]